MTGTIHPLPTERTPERFRQMVREALLQYWQQRTWEIEQAVIGCQVGVPGPEGLQPVLPEVLVNSALADSLAEIARAADGEGPLPEQVAGEVQECIQDLCERLFSSPLLAGYEIPEEFWETPLGAMTARALFRARGDELITITEAAELLGLTVSAVSQYLVRGQLTGYPDPWEPNPARRRRVLRSDVERLKR